MPRLAETGAGPGRTASRGEPVCAPRRAPRHGAGGGEAAAATQRNGSEACEQLQLSIRLNGVLKKNGVGVKEPPSRSAPRLPRGANA